MVPSSLPWTKTSSRGRTGSRNRSLATRSRSERAHLRKKNAKLTKTSSQSSPNQVPSANWGSDLGERSEWGASDASTHASRANAVSGAGGGGRPASWWVGRVKRDDRTRPLAAQARRLVGRAERDKASLISRPNEGSDSRCFARSYPSATTAVLLARLVTTDLGYSRA